jgi:hypothetical protein
VIRPVTTSEMASELISGNPASLGHDFRDMSAKFRPAAPRSAGAACV